MEPALKQSYQVLEQFRSDTGSGQDSIIDKPKLLAQFENRLSAFIASGAGELVSGPTPDQQLLRFVTGLFDSVLTPRVETQEQFLGLRTSLRRLLAPQAGIPDYAQEVERGDIDRILILGASELLGKMLRSAARLTELKRHLSNCTEQEELFLPQLRAAALDIWLNSALHHTDINSIRNVFSVIDQDERYQFSSVLDQLIYGLKSGNSLTATIDTHRHGAGASTPFRDPEAFQKALRDKWLLVGPELQQIRAALG